MSKVNELIEKLCPNGVEYKKLGDLIVIEKGKQLNKTQIFDEGLYPVINGGINPSGYWNEFNYDENLITISQGGASAGYVNYIDKKFWAGAHCYVVKSVKDEILYKYVYHFLKSKEVDLQNSKVGAGIPSISLKDINSLCIAVPPLKVQNEIVRILDLFNNNIKILNKEMLLREKQQQYIMQKLLNNKNFSDFKTLGEISKIEKGKTALQKSRPGNYQLVATTEFLQSSDIYQFDCEAVCLPLISARGHGVASITRIFYQKGKFALGNILCAIIPNDESIKAEYLKHYLYFYKDIILVPLMKGGANVSLTIDSLKNVKVAVPTIEEQNNIIMKINVISKLLDKNHGLPAEIEARKKQYEYYRDKLLTFKKL